MTTDISQIITVNIQRNTTTPSQAGFGQALLLGYFPTTVFPERTRTYSSLTGLTTDGFTVNDPIYKMAQDLLAQSPSPTSFTVGRRALAPSQSFTFTPAAAAIVAGEYHSLNIVGPGATSGVNVSFYAGLRETLTLTGNLSDADTVTIGTTVYQAKNTMAAAFDFKIGATASDTIDNLVAAINLTGTEGTEYYAGTTIHPSVQAVAGPGDTMFVRAKKGYTASTIASTETSSTASWGNATLQADDIASLCDWLTAGVNATAATTTATDGATVVTLDADTAGDLFAYTLTGEGWTVVDATTDPGIATDLATVVAYDPDWYALAIDSNSHAEIDAAAAWIETAERLFVCQTQDTIVASTTDTADTTSVAAGLASYERTALFYHETASDYVACAMLGRVLPELAGSTTWAYKRLSSITSNNLTTTQMTNLEAKDVNFVSTIADVSVTRYGTVGTGEYADIMRGADWLKSRIEERVFTLLINNDKLPYTDAGIQAVRAEILAQLQEGVARDFLAASPEPTCTVPLAVEVSAADKSSRTLNGVKFRATLAGAIHKVAIEGELNL